jgi:undecaprenyl-phosphate 4-deoxy-4-formamido-L-arabinose transferase
MDISIVIPVYRSAQTIAALTDRLTQVLNKTGLQYQVIFVDDGSPDDTWQALITQQARHPTRISLVQLMRNYGQHNALMCGFRHSSGDLIVTMDDDLQNPPEEIPKLIGKIRSGNLDLVYGSYGNKQHSGWRNVGSAIANVFFRSVFRTRVTVSSFRIIRRCLLEAILTYNLNYTFVDGLLAWNTQRIAEVPVDHQRPPVGRSRYSFTKLFVLSINLLTNFSLLPLQLASALGLCAAAVGLLTALILLALYFSHEITVPGYASTIVALLVLGGMQLLSLGIMGEYLGRLHLNVNRKPQYVERTVTPSLPLDHFVRQDGALAPPSC